MAFIYARWARNFIQAGDCPANGHGDVQTVTSGDTFVPCISETERPGDGDIVTGG